VLIVLLTVLLTAPPAVPSDDIVQVSVPGACKDGIIHAPVGPFAAWVFCQDALGNYIGVVYADPMSAPIDGAWSLSDRFWQQDIWAADVQTLAWSKDGTRLFVSTGEVYGRSGLYQLDLIERKAYKLMAEVPGYNVEILAVDASAVRYRIRHIDTGATREGRARVRIRRNR
jgi:hypothetical protein